MRIDDFRSPRASIAPGAASCHGGAASLGRGSHRVSPAVAAGEEAAETRGGGRKVGGRSRPLLFGTSVWPVARRCCFNSDGLSALCCLYQDLPSALLPINRRLDHL
jgi:hypothetical protein